ncbi:hypothetical protein [Nitrincola sp.]|uniref:hypothetical protein n=1 Tax=Nitrincola sp. TaxID=1926584 RepID=UPI003A935D3F
MHDERSVDFLMSLQPEQLDMLVAQLEVMVVAKRAEKANSFAPPSPPSDIGRLADSLGLDLSGIMREISRK